MKGLRLAVVVFIATLSVGAVAHAQNVIIEGSHFFHPGAPLSCTCAEQRDFLRKELNSFPLLPSQWEWVVVCDDASWQMFVNRPGQSASTNINGGIAGFNETVYASTNIDARITVLRGITLLHPDSLLALPDHIIAHELGHILQHTEDEDQAERQAQFWLDSRRRGGVNVITPGGDKLVVVTVRKK